RFCPLAPPLCAVSPRLRLNSTLSLTILPAPPRLSTLSLHDALPISGARALEAPHPPLRRAAPRAARDRGPGSPPRPRRGADTGHRPLPDPRPPARNPAAARAPRP